MSYKKGDIIAGKYLVTRDFDSANGGQCQWGFALNSYDGNEYFVKKFLSPVYPGEDAPGSEKGKQKRRDQCEEFARKQLAIQNALSACGAGGSVVVMVDFFKYGDDYGEHFFKVCQKVDTSSLSKEIHTLETKKRLFVMLTAAGAMKILHSNGIVHLDLKPDNVLIQEWEGRQVAKIIDFDSSIIEGESIAAESLVGDPVYYSPEFAKHIATAGKTPAPTKKSDIFSLGLIFCQYWTGNRPVLSGSYTYAHEAVLDGKKLDLPPIKTTTKLGGTLIKNPLDTEVGKLIKKMLALSYEERPDINQVHQQLKYLYNNGVPPKDGKNKLIINMKPKL
ncbi:protein kinase domain-containing protein [Argonema antarcticum]|uniref:protein kinase domain-containing protein n=1 Tax=Argonema antarcticum TaxID=2942763 RepID=UPI00201207FD|nr:protein kinase [Argonema antarcticum]MCL1471231.1 protein kinase [Argonema antarcticum A004/B2]